MLACSAITQQNSPRLSGESYISRPVVRSLCMNDLYLKCTSFLPSLLPPFPPSLFPPSLFPSLSLSLPCLPSLPSPHLPSPHHCWGAMPVPGVGISPPAVTHHRGGVVSKEVLLPQLEVAQVTGGDDGLHKHNNKERYLPTGK